ncbi:MAG: hypothetical protein RBT41_10705 [Clostridia bacterium]|jgi:putative ABC transport system permease protein|nr:hypothetical protein [Clostridia bacterium]
MKNRMLWNDITRNKVMTLTIFLFISVAAMLLSLAALLGANLLGSIDRLMQDAQTPHFMQMHAGVLDIKKLDAFAAENEVVSRFQALKFLNIDSGQIVINGKSLAGTVQDNGFSTQSNQFDFLLDADNHPVQPLEGELYAPVFYSKDGTIKLGDTVTIHELRFTVADELTGALNSKSADEIMALFSEIHRNGTAILLVTHDAKVAASAQRVLFMQDGKIVSELPLVDFTNSGITGKAERILCEMRALEI